MHSLFLNLGFIQFPTVPHEMLTQPVCGVSLNAQYIYMYHSIIHALIYILGYINAENNLNTLRRQKYSHSWFRLRFGELNIKALFTAFRKRQTQVFKKTESATLRIRSLGVRSVHFDTYM